MDTKKIMAILKNIVSNKREVERGDQLELSFNVEPTDQNRVVFTDDEMKTYSVEEVADLINLIDIDSLEVNDIEYIKSLYRKFESDNINSNLYKNEEALIAPLFQKINEYEHVINEQEFNSNQKTLEDLTGHNNNLSSAKLISLKSNVSDSKYNLDYLRIVTDGNTELISITDPDYLERFANEFASEIKDMSASDFANRLKASTEGSLEFVKLDDYLTNDEVKSKMYTPRVKDNNVLSFEAEEVKRLVDKFMPNEDIFIGIDKYGEVFYKVRDGIIKGRTEDGVRKIDFSIVPSSLISNEKTMVDEKHEENIVQEEVKPEISEEKSVRDMDVQVQFNENRFNDLFEMRDVIINGDDPDLKNELFSQLNALFDLCYVQEVKPKLIEKIGIYYNQNVNRFKSASGSENMVKEDVMSIQEYNLMKKMDDAYNQVKTNTNEEVVNEVNEFDIQGNTHSEKEENIVDFNKYKENKDVKVRKRIHRNSNAAFSAVAIILEILTVAFVILMVLSLDI